MGVLCGRQPCHTCPQIVSMCARQVTSNHAHSQCPALWLLKDNVCVYLSPSRLRIELVLRCEVPRVARVASVLFTLTLYVAVPMPFSLCPQQGSLTSYTPPPEQPHTLQNACNDYTSREVSLAASASTTAFGCSSSARPVVFFVSRLRRGMIVRRVKTRRGTPRFMCAVGAVQCGSNETVQCGCMLL